MKRFNISVSDERADFIEKQAKKLGIPMSAVISMAVSQYIDGQKVIESLPQLLETIKIENEKKAKG